MIKSLVRANIVKLNPYICARQISQNGVLLDANENSFGSTVKTPLFDELNRYPDPASQIIKRELSKFLNVDERNIFVGVGSDEVIDLMIRVFVNPDEEIIVFEPTYGMYKVWGEINAAKVTSCLLNKDFQIDFRALRRNVNKKTKMIFCASPNSPTGNLLREKDVEMLCKMFKGIVVIDEAYVEFSSKPSLVRRIKDFENLVVLRTFSKAWGLAGLRVGYCVANAECIRFLNKIKPPYNLNILSSKLAIEALKNYEKLFDMREKIIRERIWLMFELKKLRCEVFPSEANFLLIRVKNAYAIVKKLAQRFGVVVRDFSTKPLLKDCFRVTVGTPEQNRLFIQSLSQLL